MRALYYYSNWLYGILVSCQIPNATVTSVNDEIGMSIIISVVIMLYFRIKSIVQHYIQLISSNFAKEGVLSIDYT